jgi:predicted transcriptional regulator
VEFIRELIVEGTREGPAAVRACSVSSIARPLGVSRATISKYVPEAATGRVAATRLPRLQRRSVADRLLTCPHRAPL